MVLNETIRQCLQHCAVAKDASTLQHAFAALQHAVQGRLPGDRPSGDLYVEFAEAAIQVCFVQLWRWVSRPVQQLLRAHIASVVPHTVR